MYELREPYEKPQMTTEQIDIATFLGEGSNCGPAFPEDVYNPSSGTCCCWE